MAPITSPSRARTGTPRKERICGCARGHQPRKRGPSGMPSAAYFAPPSSRAECTSRWSTGSTSCSLAIASTTSLKARKAVSAEAIGDPRYAVRGPRHMVLGPIEDAGTARECDHRVGREQREAGAGRDRDAVGLLDRALDRQPGEHRAEAGDAQPELGREQRDRDRGEV